MTQRFYIPKARVFTNDGIVGTGYKLYFYITGTDTLKDTYSDSALTVPNTNPVIADSSGYFTDIFLSDENYKVILKDENDITIWTADPQDIFTISLNAFEVRPYTHWGTTSGTSTAYTLSPNPALSTYTDTLRFSMTMSLTNTAAATLAIEDLNDLGNFLTAEDIKKYDGTGDKVDIEAGDLVINQTYDVFYDGTDFIIINPSLPFIDLSNSTNFPFLNPNWKYGFISSSNTSSPDTTLAITTGKCLALDKTTILILDTAETALNMETVLGTSLSASTSYHLFYYKNTDEEYDWHLEDSITPTISDLYSTNCYRRIVSFKTDSNGDIFRFYSYDEGNGRTRQEYISLYKGTISAASDFPTPATVRTGWTYKVTTNVTDNDATKTNTGLSFDGFDFISWQDNGGSGYWIEEFNGGIVDLNAGTTSLSTTPADITLSIPSGIKFKAIIAGYLDVANTDRRIVNVIDKNNSRLQNLIYENFTDQQISIFPVEIYTDTSAKIQYCVNVADVNTTKVAIAVLGFYDEGFNE